MKRTPLKRKTGLKAKTPLRASKSPSKALKPKKTVKTQAKLKKELDAIFSKYIRATFPKHCYTCGKTDTPLQCGHFVPRQYLATRWSEDNCRPQCVGCNIYGRGQLLDFEERLKKDLGEEKVEALKQSRHQVLKLDRQWYEAQITHYKHLVEKPL